MEDGTRKTGRVEKMSAIGVSSQDITVKTALSIPVEFGRINGKMISIEAPDYRKALECGCVNFLVVLLSFVFAIFFWCCCLLHM